MAIKKNQFDFETTLRVYKDGFIYSVLGGVPKRRSPKQNIPISRHYKAVLCRLKIEFRL